MALMVYSAPKWFLALRQACPAGVGGLPSVDHILLRVHVLLKLLLRAQRICVGRLKGNSRISHIHIQLCLDIGSRDVFVNGDPAGMQPGVLLLVIVCPRPLGLGVRSS